MPLDSHSYLVSQGWGGKGTGLRQGAISRPLAIPQKKTLAGLGKDRDEAFPFWDHLFSAAAKSIQIKCLSDDEEEKARSTNTSMKCTSTGILSNRRPTDGTPASSGTNTPETAAHRFGLLATAKRDAAKRGLYSKFFRGPVLGPDTIIEEEKRLAALVSQAFSANGSITETVLVQETIDIQTPDGNVRPDLEVSKSSKKRRKRCEKKEEAEEAKRERKRRKKEKKTERHGTEKRHKKEKYKEDMEATLGTLSSPILKGDQKIGDASVHRGGRNAQDDHESQVHYKSLKKELKKLSSRMRR